MTAIYAVMVVLLMLILLQFLLLSVAMEDFLSGKGTVMIAATIGSGLCFAISWQLVRRLPVGKQSRD
jgi:hypothetical protein